MSTSRSLSVPTWILATVLQLSLASGQTDSDARSPSGESSNPTSWPVQFQDDFSHPRRDKYGTAGNVEWITGGVLLKEGARLWPKVETGARLELDLDLELRDSDPRTARTELHFPLSNNRALVLRLEPAAAAIQLTELSSGRTRVQVLREVQRETGAGRGRWRIAYSYGMLRAERDGQLLIAAHADGQRSVGGAMLIQHGGTLVCRNLALRGLPPDPKYTLEEQRRIRAALDEFQRARNLRLEDDNALAAKPLADRAYNSLQELLGPKHVFTIQAMAEAASAQVQLFQQDPEVLAQLEQALARAIEVYGDRHPQVGLLWNQLAAARLLRDDFWGALRGYQQELEVYRDVYGESSQRVGTLLVQMGNAASQIGSSNQARPLLEQAVAVLKHSSGEDSPEVADAHCVLGAVLIKERDYRQARQHLERAVRNYGASGDTEPLLLLTHQQLAELAHREKNLDEEHHHYQRAWELAQARFGDEHAATLTMQTMLGVVAKARHDDQRAFTILTQVHEASIKAFGQQSPYTASALGTLAVLQLDRGNGAEASRLAGERLVIDLASAARLLPGISEAEGLALVRQTYESRDFSLAVMRRVPATTPRDAYRPVWQSRALVSRSVQARQQLPISNKAAAEQALELQQLRRQIATFALAPLERQSAAARERMLATLTDRKETIERSLLQGHTARLSALAALETDPSKLAATLPPKTAVIDCIRTAGLAGAAEAYHAFILRRPAEGLDEVVSVQLGDATPIDQAIAAWRWRVPAGRGLELLPEPDDLESLPQPEVRLRTLVWEKLEPHLSGIEHVVVIPDQALARIPWGALPGRSEGTYLLQQYAFSKVSYGQRLYDLLSTKPRDASRAGKLLLVGDLEYGARGGSPGRRDRWKPLAGTAEEIDKLSGIWGHGTTEVRLTKAQAGEAALRESMPQASVIHLATHGFFADRKDQSIFQAPCDSQSFVLGQVLGDSRHAASRNPLTMSGLVLSQANVLPRLDRFGMPEGTDGLLTAEEVVGLDLNATRLVVLSACETGLGDTAGGEGVFGLQRAFELSGASTCIASLWHVPDRPTQMLMTRFYKNLWTDRSASLLSALREAQLWMLQTVPQDPALLMQLELNDDDAQAARAGRLPVYYWSAFDLSGDWR